MANPKDDIEFSIRLDTQSLRKELDGLNNLGQRFGRTMVRSFASAITSGRKFSSVLRSLALSLSSQALSAAIRPLGNAMGGVFSGLFASARGNAFSQGRPKAFANGGIVNSPTLFPLRSGAGLMGEAGPEAILPLARGRDGRLGVASAGAASISVTMNITTPDAESFQKSQTQIAATLARSLERGQRNL